MSTIEKLVYMANQIAANFASLGHSASVAATADHLARFWERGMRAKLLAHARQPDHGLSTAADEAIRSLYATSEGEPG